MSDEVPEEDRGCPPPRHPSSPEMNQQLDSAIDTALTDLTDENKHIPLNEDDLEYDENLPGAVFLNAKVFAELIANDERLQNMIKEELKNQEG